MSLRLAIVVSHPIQYFTPWYRELAQVPDLVLKVFFCCDWGAKCYFDPQFKTEIRWDIPLLEGYDHEFLTIARRPERLGFWRVDNPSVGLALDRFQPDVVKILGYAHRTNWRVGRWARQNHRPLMLYSDSNSQIVRPLWKRFVKHLIVGKFYKAYVDGAFFVGENNRRYHANYGVPSQRLFRGVLPVEAQRLLESVPHCGVARSELRSRFGIPANAFVVMFCGKYQPHKRPLDLVMAVHRLVAEGLPIWCLLVGDGPERNNISVFCQREKLLNVVLTGFVNQSEIGPFYAASDVLVMPSSLDAYPLAVSEACVFGLPIVISDRVGCAGINESAQPESNAIVYSCGDIKALAAAIERLWRDSKLYRAMVAASSKIAATRDVMAATHLLAGAVRRLHQLGPRTDYQDRLQSSFGPATS